MFIVAVSFSAGMQLLIHKNFNYPKPFTEVLLKAGVIISGDTIDIITTRLQSVHFQRNDYVELSNIKSGTDSGFTGTRNIINKLRLGYKRRIEQVKLA